MKIVRLFTLQNFVHTYDFFSSEGKIVNDSVEFWLFTEKLFLLGNLERLSDMQVAMSRREKRMEAKCENPAETFPTRLFERSSRDV